MRMIAAAIFTTMVSSFATAQQVQGELIFAVEVVEQSLRVDPLERQGIFFYYDETRPGLSPTLNYFSYVDGEIVKRGGQGTIGTELFINKLLSHPIVSFDVEEEITSTIEFLQAQSREDGSRYSPPLVLDGSKYLIVYNFNGVRLEYEAWNPGPVIDDLAKYNPNIKDLKELIDLFAIEYARRDFGL